MILLLVSCYSTRLSCYSMLCYEVLLFYTCKFCSFTVVYVLRDRPCVCG